MTSQCNKISAQQNQINIALPGEGELIDLNQLISQAPNHAVVHFGTGSYRLKDTVSLNKPIKLMGEGCDKTEIIGVDLDLMFNSSGDHQIELESAAFVINSDAPATAIRIVGGRLKVRDCAFVGGVIDSDGNNGFGLCVNGITSIEIEGCRFEANQNAGIWLDDQSQGKVIKNTFDNNETGLAAVGKSRIDAKENTFTRNHVSLAYDGLSMGTIENNSFIENRGGILIKGEANVEILKNTLSKNDGAAGFIEECTVLFEDNSIEDGFMTLVLRNSAKVVIKRNSIKDNDQGIMCTDQSNSEIIENTILGQDKFGILVQNDSITHILSNIIQDNTAGIKFDHFSKFSAVENQITSNKLYGVLATDEAHGQIHKNVIENNDQDPLGWNFQVRELAFVDFDDYKETQSEGKPVPYSLIDDQLVVSPLQTEESVSFDEFITQLQHEQVVIFTEGDYQLSKPIVIDKPTQLVAKSPGKVFITGEDPSHLLEFRGDGVLSVKGICFSLASSGQTNIFKVKSGHLVMDECVLEGARDHQGKKRDFGAGLLISGTASAAISNSVFKNNLLGIAVQDNASITLQANQFSKNFYGIIFRDHSTGSLSGNQYSQNTGYGLMAYDQSDVTISNDSCHHNQAGFGFINHVKTKIEGAESHHNEIHGFFIDNHSSCEIRNSHSHSNEISGIAIYGENITVLEGNTIHSNSQAGIESAENAQSIIKANDLWSNSFGILLVDNAHSEINGNTIHKNEVGVKIQDEAKAIIKQNKIFSNAKGGIVDWSNSEPQIAENDIFNNGDPSDDENQGQDEDDLGISYGDFLADLLGSENLSDDPGIAAIPLGDSILTQKESLREDGKIYNKGSEEDSE